VLRRQVRSSAVLSSLARRILSGELYFMTARQRDVLISPDVGRASGRPAGARTTSGAKGVEEGAT